MIEDWGEAPVPPTWPEIKIASALRLRDTRRDRADTRARDQLHADRRGRVDLLQVVDQLREVFDRIDVVMRRRRNQRHARRRVTQTRDQIGDLRPRQLPAFAGLGPLRDLDFELAAIRQIFGRNAEAARRDLLDRRGCIVAIGTRLVARGILAAFAGIGLRTDAVHRDGERFMRFGPEGAERDTGRHEMLADLGDAFDLVDRDRLAARLEVEQIADD